MLLGGAQLHDNCMGVGGRCERSRVEQIEQGKSGGRMEVEVMGMAGRCLTRQHGSTFECVGCDQWQNKKTLQDTAHT